MGLSLATGFLMLAGKFFAYRITGSAAVLSDAFESVIHVLAVGFATYSMWLSARPADADHPYGHDKVSFFSAGVEGALICVAAVSIIVVAVRKWIVGLALEQLTTGILLVALAGAVNAVLGAYLLWQSKRHRSLILEANGKHVLTDSWTSLGVIAGLALVAATGWKPFDPICAILVALNIVWSGHRLVSRSVRGLMDESDSAAHAVIVAVLERACAERGVSYHALRHRDTGLAYFVEFHLVAPREAPLEEAHRIATEIEEEVARALPLPSEVISHVEPVGAHGGADLLPAPRST
jgi:cation diffusion facilitator family transporter